METLLADNISDLHVTELSDLDTFFQLQRDIERQEIEQGISDGGLSDSLCNNDGFYRGDENE